VALGLLFYWMGRPTRMDLADEPVMSDAPV
jgi:hypothetical protein